jgi:hypothetical protein
VSAKSLDDGKERGTKDVSVRLLLAIPLLVLGMASGVSVACDCTIPTPVQARTWSDASFSGPILFTFSDPPDPNCPYKYATVRVEACWKGGLQVGQVVFLHTPNCIGGCGEEFVVGERMVWFVWGKNPLSFYTEWCYGNTAPTPEVLEALGPPKCEVAIESSPWSSVKKLYGIK